MPNINIPFTTPANYTYDNTKIEVTGGLAQLINLFDFSSAIAHWKLNDNIATTNVIDEIGSFDGIAQQNTNLLSVTGLVNNALTFNGSSDYIELGINSILPNDSWSFFAVFKTANLTTYRTIYSEGRTTSTNHNVVFQVSNSGTITFSVNNNINSFKIESSSQYDDNNWHTLVGIKKATNDWELYIDGNSEILTNSTNVTNPIIDLVGIGALFRSSILSFFDGTIDNTFIISNIASANEILNWHNLVIEELKGYDKTNPSIYLTTGLTATNVLNWSSFSVTSGTVEGTLGFQLSNDGITWKYWNGAIWTTATTQTNLEATINTNISTFPITGSKIYVKTFTISDGTQLNQIDNISIPYIDNLAPNVGAGSDKTAILSETIKPFSDSTFSDSDGTITKAEYKVDGEVDVWTEIPQGIFGTLLEAVQDFDYTFNNTGTKIVRLQVTDNDLAVTSDSLNVVVAKTSVTFNITDADTGLDLSSITFTPGDNTSSSNKNSPFNYNYALGTFSIILVKTGYFSVVQDITIAVTGETKNISMFPTAGITELVEEINIDINTEPLLINIEVN